MVRLAEESVMGPTGLTATWVVLQTCWAPGALLAPRHTTTVITSEGGERKKKKKAASAPATDMP